MGDNERLRVMWLGDWAALREACRQAHKPGPGGAAMCYCGRGGGGAACCSALRQVRDFLAALDPEAVPAGWREWLETIQREAA